MLTITFCTCESEAETLLQACLFPATPKHLQMVFTFALLDWLEAVMFECQFKFRSAQDFSAALGMLSDTQLMMVRTALYCMQLQHTTLIYYIPLCFGIYFDASHDSHCHNCHSL